MEQIGPREVRLRSGYAKIYPEMPADTWMPASRWAESIVARAQQARRRGEHIRTFDPRHFEFRGGAPPRGPGEEHLHTRAEDR